MGESENKSSSKSNILVWTVIIALIGLFVWAIVIPNLRPARVSGPPIPCVINLVSMDAAKKEWALENGRTNGAIVTDDDIKPYIKLDSKDNLPRCPQGGTHTIGKIGEPPTCSLGTTVVPAHKLP